MLILLLTMWLRSYADDLSVVLIKKNLPLKSTDETYYDYYINGGLQLGLKVGSTVDIYRTLPILESHESISSEALVIPIAKLKIIHVQKTLSIARLIAYYSKKTHPIGDFEGVMMGDQVTLSGPPKEAPDQPEIKAESKAPPEDPLPKPKSDKIEVDPSKREPSSQTAKNPAPTPANQKLL